MNLLKNKLKLNSEMINKFRNFNLAINLLSLGKQNQLQLYSVMNKISLQVYSVVTQVQVLQHQFKQHSVKINNLKVHFSVLNHKDQISQLVVAYSVDSAKLAKDYRINSVKAFHNK